MSELRRPPRPKTMKLTDVSDPAAFNEVVALSEASHPLGKAPHVLLEIHKGTELDLAGARELYRWLGNWILWRTHAKVTPHAK